jgi:hypothetical protein
VQQAAPQEARPPKYQRDTRSSAAMAGAAAAGSLEPGPDHDSGRNGREPGSKCHRAPAHPGGGSF